MSHPLPNLEAAIYSRLTGDTGSGGLFQTGSVRVNELRNTFATPGVAPPYLVFTIRSCVNADYFNKRGYEIVFKVDAFVAEEAASQYGKSHMRTVNERIIGNWAPPSTAPTYGLHGWTPSAFADGWTPTLVHHQSSTDSDEPGMLHTEHLFLTYVTVT